MVKEFKRKRLSVNKLAAKSSTYDYKKNQHKFYAKSKLLRKANRIKKKNQQKVITKTSNNIEPSINKNNSKEKRDYTRVKLKKLKN